MRMNGANTHRHIRRIFNAGCVLALTLAVFARPCAGQTAGTSVTNSDLAQRMQKLTDAMARTQAQLQESQRELQEMRREMADLLRELQPGVAVPDSAQAANEQSTSSLSAAVDDLRERQQVAESQIATHEQAKVETASKYPLRLHGLVLFNSFVNTGRVDDPVTPAFAIGGAGSTGGSMRQTILGIDAAGPHIAGAQSYADLDMDFDAGAASSYAVSLARLRTAHAGLHWTNTDAWFALDRSLLSPLLPSSLTSVAQPALSWSGNLWTWNPQLGATHRFALNESNEMRVQAAFIDAGDVPYSTSNSSAPAFLTPSTAEQSRWPGVEARVAWVAQDRDDTGNQLGISGYVAPHLVQWYRYDAWAASADGRLHLPRGLELSGSAYRGLALGGLGGGAYKDYAYAENPLTGAYYFRPLDNIGGWAQLKEKVSDRLEFNAAFGTDQIVAHQFRYYATATNIVQNLVANRTFTGNLIFRPSAWTLISLEYRHLASTPANGAAAESNVIGLAAGYSF